ncbi:Uncharacterised protein [Mycobacteroides abscessus subsp. abscessus]|nr:Uncharacterised protein [Mycobacteroides abscessus subsp. abscessus]
MVMGEDHLFNILRLQLQLLQLMVQCFPCFFCFGAGVHQSQPVAFNQVNIHISNRKRGGDD